MIWCSLAMRIMKCQECGNVFEFPPRKPRRTCSKECRSRASARTMARTNRQYASVRMKKRNPMRRADVRARVSLTLRAIGHKPKVRGGNGKGPTVCERALSRALGWPTSVVIRTGKKRGSGYPGCYKVDLGNLALKVAIEVDGSSHCALERKRQDRKKEKLLHGLGWKVLRFTNEQVNDSLSTCVQTVLSTISK